MQYGGGGTVESNSESIVATIGFEYGWLLEDINENGGGGDGLGKPPQIPRSKLGQVAAQGWSLWDPSLITHHLVPLLSCWSFLKQSVDDDDGFICRFEPK